MRILHISKKIPYPQKDGESIANTNLARSLQSLGVDIDLLSLNTNKHYSDHDTARENLPFYTQVNIVDHELKLRPTVALKHLLTDKSYNIERFKSAEFTRQLEDILAEHSYNCILLETIYVLPYIETIRRLSAGVVILRAHNVEHHIWEKKAQEESNFAKSHYLDKLSKQLQTYQETHIPLCDGVITVSSVDYDWYKTIVSESKLSLSPIGINHSEYQSYKKKDSNFTFGFIGAMDWQPNINGIEWYLEKVWPMINKEHPKLEFHLAGRNMPSNFYTEGKQNVINHGEVERSLAFISSLDVLVVPLFIASGIRVKIIEAMAMGKLVISTEKGLQGIAAQDSQEVIIANTASQMMKMHNIIMKDSALFEKISSQARSFALDHFDQQKLTDNIIAFINRRIEDKLSFS